jgi:hypothetical protein
VERGKLRDWAIGKFRERERHVDVASIRTGVLHKLGTDVANVALADVESRSAAMNQEGMRQVLRLILVACTLCMGSGVGRAQPTVPSPQGPAVTQASGEQLTAYQAQTLEVERAKINLQHEQLKLETQKARWTALGVFVPLAVVVFGLATLVLQLRAQFQLKAAELVLASYSPGAAENRIHILRRMFPRWLVGKKFGNLFDRTMFPGVRLHEMKMDLFRALTAKDANRRQIWEAWLEVFPEERARFADLFPSAVDAIREGSAGKPAADVKSANESVQAKTGH